MSDNENDFDDDFDADIDFEDDGFGDMEEEKGTLGDLWRNNPFLKIGIILLGLALLVGGIILFGGEKEQKTVSRVSGGSDVTEAPGSAEVSQEYLERVEEENVRRTEDAVRTSDSVLPIPTGVSKGTIDAQFEEPEEEDPLERWRRMQEERVQEQQTQAPQRVEVQQPPKPPPPDPKEIAVNAMAQAMSSQMQAILGNQSFNGPAVQNVTPINYLEVLKQQEQELLAQTQARAQSLGVNNTALQNQNLNILLPAGTIEYAQLLIEANTDAPGPVLAEIATGPLKGARLIGSFSENYNYLTLNFDTIILEGIDYGINGIAIDPATSLPGVITEIDRRYLRRVALPAAAAFVEGLAGAVASSGRTSITIEGDSVSQTTDNDDLSNDQEVALGLEEAASEVGEIFDEIIDDTKPMLRVAPGTPLGILFVDAVTATPRLLQNNQDNQRQIPFTGQGINSNLPSR
jgi:intracellular multiplication protein IcmE